MMWSDDHHLWEIAGPVLFSPERTRDVPSDVRRLRELLSLQPGDRVLDLCCGAGRHAIELARHGLRVVAVDRTRRYLELARSSARQAQVPVAFLQGDMRDFSVAPVFDAALNLSTSFGYFEEVGEDLRVACNLRHVLKPGASAVFEMMGKETLATRWPGPNWTKAGDVLLLEDPVVLDDWAAVEYRWTLVAKARTAEFTIRVRLYSGIELRRLLENAGFSEVELFGGFDGRPYDRHAEVLVARARV